MKRFFVLLLLTACASRPAAERLHVQTAGSGRGVPVLLVHGNTGNLTQWNAQIEHLRTSRRVVALDLRGMGRSAPAPDGDYSLDAFVSDVLAAADRTRLKRFVLVGHSFGGTVAGRFAERYPERLAGLVLVDAAGTIKIPDDQAQKVFDGIRADKDRFMNGWFAPILANSSDEVKEAVMDSVARTPADVILGAIQAFNGYEMLKALDSYRGPKLAIAAAAIEQAFSLHVQNPAIPTKKLAGTGHWLMMDKPDEFNGYLDEFLAAIDARSGT
jgi:pimeloyl-ACP methyl ester carboxylesterase